MDEHERRVPLVLTALLVTLGFALGIIVGAQMAIPASDEAAAVAPAAAPPTAAPTPAAAGTPTAATAEPSSPPPSPRPSPTYLYVSDVQPGQCVNGISDPEGYFLAAAVVPCDEPHEMEVMGHHVLDEDDDAPYPSEDELDEMADRRCVAQFREYVGRPVALTNYDYMWVYPSEHTWQAGDRQITCFVLSLTGRPLVGPVREP